MIGKVAKAGKGFRGAISYLLQGDRDKPNPNRVAWAETRNLFSNDPDDAPSLMRATASKNSRCKSPVYHYVISWHKNEAPTDDLMRTVADTTCDDLGLTEYERVYIAHTDTDHRHVHIVVNRIHPETAKAWNRGQDWVEIELSLRRQSEAHGLMFVPGRHNTKTRSHRPRRARTGDYRAAKKQGREARSSFSLERIQWERMRLSPLFDTAKSWNDLSQRLALQNLRLETKGQGLVITDGKEEMKLSDLGKDIRLKGLEKRFDEEWQSFDKPKEPAKTFDQPQPGKDVPPFAATPLRAAEPARGPEPGESAEDIALFKKAQETAHWAFTFYNIGLIDRKQLARAVRDRDFAREILDQHKSFMDRLVQGATTALSSDSSAQKPPADQSKKQPSQKPTKTNKKRRGRDR